MKRKRRFRSRKSFNFLTVFLVLDLFIIFTVLKTSNASYTSTAVGTSDMQVALYAFRYEGLEEINGVDGDLIQNREINLGDLTPGETKYYKFRVYNTDNKNTVADTNISYNLKIITTTNIGLEYKLYLNQNPLSANRTNLIENDNIDEQIFHDAWGTYFRSFALPERCFKYGAEKFDEYTLEVIFPDKYKNSQYQDLIESIKIQLTSRQVLPDDEASINNMCR